VTAVYWWQGHLEDAQEWSVTFKTTADLAHKLVVRVRSLHPYDVPEILVIPVTDGDPDYLRWVEQETTAHDE
jgi:periplasmic divalent cation tolerance protein